MFPLSVSRGNDWTDCVEIRYVVREPLARRFTEIDDEVRLRVRTCAPLFRLPYLANGWTIALKFGEWLWDQQ